MTSPYGDISRLRTNVTSYRVLDSLNSINKDLASTLLKLSTGRRIVSAGDDPAGYIMGVRFDARSRGLTTALGNVEDAQNLLSTAEGGLGSITEVLLTMKEKVTQAASDSLGDDERTAIESELDGLAAEIDSIVSQTKWNDLALLDGTFSNKSFQVGEGPADTMSFGITQDHDATALGVSDASLVVTSASFASQSLGYINDAIDLVTNTTGSIGGTQSRLSLREEFLSNYITNTEAAESRIMDADMAKEQINSVVLQILQTTTVATLSQANLRPQLVLSLFTGQYS